MAFNVTGAKYAIRALTAVGTTNVTIGAATFVSGDFGVVQRIAVLYTSANVFKGIAWVRRFVSTTQIELENRFVDPVTGLFATQVVGDQVLISKNLAESVVTGLAWDGTNRVATLTDGLNIGTSNVETSACIYEENATIAMRDAIQTTGGVVVFGKLVSYDGSTRESYVWNRDVWLNPLNTFNGAGAGSYNYTMLRPNGAGGHFFMFGGNIGGSYQSSNFMGIVGAGTGGKSFAFFGTRQNYGCTSPSNGTTWGANAARHLLYNCFFEATYGNANLIMWGDGTWIGGNITFPQYGSGPLGAFRANGTSNYAAPSGKRALVSDLGQGALIDGIVSSTYNFTNLITPAVNSVRTGSSGASTINATFSYQDDFSNVRPRSTIVVRRTVDSVVSTSVVNTASTTFTAKVLQASYTSNTTGNLTQTANYSSFDWTAKCYGYSVLSGNYAVVNYSLGTGGTGKNVTLGGLINQLPDEGVTLTEENALALSSKINVNSTAKVITITADATFDDVYDYSVAWGCSSAANAQIPTLARYLFAANGADLSAYAGWSMVVNSGVTLSSGAKFTKIYAPTITLNGTGQITGIYATTAGVSTIWQFEALALGTHSACAVWDIDGNTLLYVRNPDSPIKRLYLPPGSDLGELTYGISQYGKKFETGTFPADAGGLIFYRPAYGDDVGIVEQDLTVVEAYTKADTLTEVYDAAAAFKLTEQGIKLGDIAIRSGTAIEVGSYSVKVKQNATSVFGVAGNLITIKSTLLAGDSKYSTIIAAAPATVTADTNEVITANIEDANGNSSLEIQGGSGNFTLWKIPNATAEDDYATGVNLGTVGNVKFRFVAAPGYKIIVRDNTTGFRQLSPMDKGVYTAGLFFGGQVQLVQAPQVVENGVKLSVLQVAVDALIASLEEVKGDGFASSDSLHLIKSVIDALPILSEIESSTVLAKETSVASVGSLVADLPLLSEIEASTVLAKESSITALGAPLQADDYVLPDNATIAEIQTKVDTLQNVDLSGVPADVWAYAVRTLTTAAGLTEEQVALLEGIKTQTDLLPAQPAGVGDAMTLTTAYDASKTAASQSSVNALGSPLQAGDYVEPDNAGIAVLVTDVGNVPLAVRQELATELARIDVEVSTRSDLTVEDIPEGLTVAEIEASTVLAKEKSVQNTMAIAASRIAF